MGGGRSSGPGGSHVGAPASTPSPARWGCAPGAAPPEPLARRPRRARRALPSARGHCGWRELHGCRPPDRTTAQRDDLRLGQPLQPRRARRRAARPWGRTHGGGPRIRYGADAQQRILAEWARTPQREPDGTATWSLSLLQKALRQAPDGLPRVSTFTIGRTLHAGGLSWQKSRTWCETGVVMRT